LHGFTAQVLGMEKQLGTLPNVSERRAEVVVRR
jgi:hypothetical protein